MSLPFGLIFSIFLIIIFIVIAFVAIKYFLNLGDCTKIGRFYEELQQKVDEAWKSQMFNSEMSITLPSGFDKLCFANLSAPQRNASTDYNLLSRYDLDEANTYVLPSEKACEMPFKLIKHINISEITKYRNPYCIPVSQKIKIKKGVYDKNVFLE